MKKILAAVDGSDASLHAAKAAVKLAGELHCPVTLVHVTPPAPATMFPPEVPMMPAVDLRDAELAQGQAILKGVTDQLPGTQLEVKNLLGPPAEVIADYAVDHGYDLVVVGNTGRNAVSRMLLGSVADRLVHICQRPVMVVR